MEKISKGGNYDMSSMRGIDTPVRQRRRRVFKEVANLAYNSTNLKDDMEALPYKIVDYEESEFWVDPSSQSIIKQLLQKYNEEHGATVIISSHNLNHTVDVCPRIALLEHGVIIRDIENENNSAEKELEAYFNVSVEEKVETENDTDEETPEEEQA